MVYHKAMKYIFLTINLVSTAIHLYASYNKNQHLRNITKPFIISSLLGYYCLSANIVRWEMVLALIFSWLGDIFLIGKGIRYFTIGGISFMIGHFFFILSYLYDITFSNMSFVVVGVLAICFLIAVTIIFKNLKAYLPKALFYPMYLYLLINGENNCFAVFRYLSNSDFRTLLTCVGAFMFFVSDSSLFFVRFKKDTFFKTHFVVMLTYSIGELLIVLGML